MVPRSGLLTSDNEVWVCQDPTACHEARKGCQSTAPVPPSLPVVSASAYGSSDDDAILLGQVLGVVPQTTATTTTRNSQPILEKPVPPPLPLPVTAANFMPGSMTTVRITQGGPLGNAAPWTGALPSTHGAVATNGPPKVVIPTLPSQGSTHAMLPPTPQAVALPNSRPTPPPSSHIPQLPRQQPVAAPSPISAPPVVVNTNERQKRARSPTTTDQSPGDSNGPVSATAAKQAPIATPRMKLPVAKGGGSAVTAAVVGGATAENKPKVAPPPPKKAPAAPPAVKKAVPAPAGPSSSAKSGAETNELRIVEDTIRVPTAGGPVAGAPTHNVRSFNFTTSNFGPGTSSKLASAMAASRSTLATAEDSSTTPRAKEAAEPQEKVKEYDPNASMPSVLRRSANGSAAPKPQRPKKGIRWNSGIVFNDDAGRGSRRKGALQQQQQQQQQQQPQAATVAQAVSSVTPWARTPRAKVSTAPSSASASKTVVAGAGIINEVSERFRSGRMRGLFYTGPRPHGPDDESCIPKMPSWMKLLKQKQPRPCKTIRRLPDAIFENVGPRMIGCSVTKDAYADVGIFPATEWLPVERDASMDASMDRTFEDDEIDENDENDENDDNEGIGAAVVVVEGDCVLLEAE